MSRSQMDRTGKRLVDEPRERHASRDEYLTILEFYQALLDEVSDALTGLGLTHTSRVKTLSTLVEKLEREPTTKLTRVNDVAGARIVLDGGHQAQDAACASIASFFDERCPRPSQTIDRRSDPRSGYRAMHIVVYPMNYPVEIQVRTKLQDLWAQIYEGLADQWGREIRYGGEPLRPDTRVVLAHAEHEFSDARFRQLEGRRTTRRGVVKLLHSVGDIIESIENLEELSIRQLDAAQRFRSIKADLPDLGSLGEIHPGHTAYDSVFSLLSPAHTRREEISANLSTVAEWRSAVASLMARNEGDPITETDVVQSIDLFCASEEIAATKRRRGLKSDFSDVAGVLDLIARLSEPEEESQ